MLFNLIIDGNFLLSKLVFTLHKNNLLYGGLHKSLEMSVLNYKKWYPFKNVYLVSDSKEKSWRKDLNSSYKATRKKDSDIDWEFVYTAYGEFKDTLKSKRIKVLEAPHIEGDDFISYVVSKANQSNQSNLIISNDYDIKQLVNYNLDPLWINMISNEMYNKQKLFLPKNYQLFLNSVNKLSNNDDIFNLNDNYEFTQLINSFISKYEIHEINSIESLIVKIISGDSSDNISSVWSIIKNGKKRGIGESGAKSIFDEYLISIGEPKIDDSDLAENIAHLICDKKKLVKSNNIESIKENIENNIRLIHLDISNFPDEIIKKMEKSYDQAN